MLTRNISMKRFTFLLMFAAILAGVQTVQAAPSAQELIAQVRAKIGTEEKLNAVTTLTFEGKIFDAEGKEIGFVQVQGKIPAMRREYRLLNNGTTEIMSGTDGLEGFMKTVSVPTRQGTLGVMPGKEVSLFRDFQDADMRFFATPRGGKVTYGGEAKQQGKDCHILDYKFAGGLYLRRYIDKKTFLVVAQEIMPSGEGKTTSTLLVEEGEIIEGGIRFPKKTTFIEDGKKTGTIEYTSVIVNRDIPDSAFAFPMP